MSVWVLKRKYQCSWSQGETAEGRRVCEDFYLQQGQRRRRKDEEELHIPSGSQHGLSYKKKTNPDQFLAVINSLFFKSCELCLRMKNHDSKSNCKPSNSSWNEALKNRLPGWVRMLIVTSFDSSQCSLTADSNDEWVDPTHFITDAALETSTLILGVYTSTLTALNQWMHSFKSWHETCCVPARRASGGNT